METTNYPIPLIFYSYLFFVCAVAFTLILAMIAIMAVQCVVYSGMPALIHYLKNVLKK